MTVSRKEYTIPVGNLEIGMHVVGLDRPWEETDFLLQGFYIKTPEDIAALASQCDHVIVDSLVDNPAKKYELKQTYSGQEKRKEKQGLFARLKTNKESKNKAKVGGKAKKQIYSERPPSVDTRVFYHDKIATEKELGRANRTYFDAKGTIKGFINGLSEGKRINVKNARSTVNDVVDSVLRNKDALTWLTKIKHRDDYTAEHSLNVSIISATFARYLGHAEAEVRRIAFCGLLHDVGKSKIPADIINKEGRFTDDEFEIMRQHTNFGKELLEYLPMADQIAGEVALCHHERIDGSGYPNGLYGDEIPYYARLIAIVDCYDAITSSRVYDGARSSMEALDIIYKCRGTHFDSDLALEFIRCIGIYPAGAIVELTNGEVGIIVSTSDDNKLKPRILMVRSQTKEVCEERELDLSNTVVDAQGVPYAIARELSNGSFGVDVNHYLKRGIQIYDVSRDVLHNLDTNAKAQ